MASVAASRREIASENARRLSRAEAADSMACGRPCPAMSTLYPQRTARCHKTVIKLSFQDVSAGAAAIFVDPDSRGWAEIAPASGGFLSPRPHAIIAAMTADARLADAFARLPDYLGSHVLVSITALAIGLGVSLPLAIASRRRPVLRGTLLTVASVVQTIPGLALLALFYPLLLALAGAVRARCSARASRRSAFCPRCWRWRSIRCCRCCATR